MRQSQRKKTDNKLRGTDFRPPCRKWAFIGPSDWCCSKSNRLEKECGDDLSAASYRTSIYMNLGHWRLASDAAVFLHQLFLSKALIAALAFFELGKYDDVLAFLLFGTMN